MENFNHQDVQKLSIIPATSERSRVNELDPMEISNSCCDKVTQSTADNAARSSPENLPTIFTTSDQRRVKESSPTDFTRNEPNHQTSEPFCEQETVDHPVISSPEEISTIHTISDHCRLNESDPAKTEPNHLISDVLREKVTQHTVDHPARSSLAELPTIQPASDQTRVLHSDPRHRVSDPVCEEATKNAVDEPTRSNSDANTWLEFNDLRPPDGGWGWIVVAASFVINLIADGISFSFGVIFVEFHKYFGYNRGTTAWVGGVFMAMPLLSGPVASFLTDRYGCRKVTIFGAILACGGFVVSSQTDSMAVLCVTFGILAGFGLSLCYVASVVIVAYYFDSKRSLATGLSVCGSGIGTFIFAPFIQYLLNEYGWRGTTLILASLLLNLAVCGALMRDLPSNFRKPNKRPERKTRRDTRNQMETSFERFSQTNLPSIDEKVVYPRIGSSLVNLPKFVSNGDQTVERSSAKTRHKYPEKPPSTHLIRSNSVPEVVLIAHSPRRHTLVPADYVTTPTVRNKFTRERKLSVSYRGAVLNINRPRARSCPHIHEKSKPTKGNDKWYTCIWDFWDIVIQMFDFSHFAYPEFLLFAISNFLLYAWYDIPYVYITDNAMSMGVSEENASMLISIIGIVNMFGEVLLGWLGDRMWVDAGLVYAICMGLCGAFTALIPLVRNYAVLCILCGLYGFFIAANYSLTSIILVDLLTLDRFTNAYGLLLLVQGIANLIGIPLGGWLCDITNTFYLSFYLAGLFIAISGIPLIVVPLVKKLKRMSLRYSSSKPEELREV